MDDRNISLISAGVAFFGILALFPGLAALIAIFGLVADPVVIDEQLDLLINVMPSDALALLDTQVIALVSAGSNTLGVATVLSILAALWSARAGVAALIRGLNAINRAPNRSGFWHYVAALTLTLSLVLMAIVTLFAIVGTSIALALLPFEDQTANWILRIRWCAAICAVFLAIWMLYRFAPNRSGKEFKRIFPGIFFAMSSWAITSYGFSYYLANFGNYNEVYGSIGAVLALLRGLYLSSFPILLGAAINVEIDAHSDWKNRQ
jgi:membrane protein